MTSLPLWWAGTLEKKGCCKSCTWGQSRGPPETLHSSFYRGFQRRWICSLRSSHSAPLDLMRYRAGSLDLPFHRTLRTNSATTDCPLDHETWNISPAGWRDLATLTVLGHRGSNPNPFFLVSLHDLCLSNRLLFQRFRLGKHM